MLKFFKKIGYVYPNRFKDRSSRGWSKSLWGWSKSPLVEPNRFNDAPSQYNLNQTVFKSDQADIVDSNQFKV